MFDRRRNTWKACRCGASTCDDWGQMIVWNVGRRRGMRTASHPYGCADERLGCSSAWIVCCRCRTSMVCRPSGSSCAPWGSRHVQMTCRMCSMETAFHQYVCACASWGCCSWGTSFRRAHSGRLLLPCVLDCLGSLGCWTSLKSTKCHIMSQTILSVSLLLSRVYNHLIIFQA